MLGFKKSDITHTRHSYLLFYVRNMEHLIALVLDGIFAHKQMLLSDKHFIL